MYQEKKKTMRRVCRFTVMMLMSFIILHNNTSFLTDVSAAEPTGTPTVSPNPSSEPKKEDKVATTPSPAETLPDIEIFIDIPDGYFSDKAVVTFSLKSKDGSMPKIQSVKAKAGKDGKYQDVTTTMRFEITEDCTVHVVATDTDGRTYERSRKITCFDKVKPTLNASVSEGILEVVAKDDGSGVKSIIVNGYEYTDHKNGKLTIRLSQFDAGYDKFVIQATDNAGNTSDKYNVKNPYKKNKDSNSDYDPATELPLEKPKFTTLDVIREYSPPTIMEATKILTMSSIRLKPLFLIIINSTPHCYILYCTSFYLFASVPDFLGYRKDNILFEKNP